MHLLGADRVAPERGDRGPDQVGVVLGEIFVVEAEFFEFALVVGIDHDIGGFDEAAEVGLPLAGGKIDHDAALGGVVVPEIEALFGVGDIVHEGFVAAGRVAFGRLELDHVGAHVGEQLAGPSAAFVAEFDHAQVVERLHRGEVGRDIGVGGHRTPCSLRSAISASERPSRSPKT